MSNLISVDITIDNAPESDLDIAEEIGKSFMKHPEEWKMFQAGYDPKERVLDITLYKGELHAEDAW